MWEGVLLDESALVDFQVRHPRCVEYKPKYNIKYIWDRQTKLYFIDYVRYVIPDTCFGLIAGPFSVCSLNRWSVQLIILSVYEISCPVKINVRIAILHYLFRFLYLWMQIWLVFILNLNWMYCKLFKDQLEDCPKIGPKHILIIGAIPFSRDGSHQIFSLSSETCSWNYIHNLIK
jgi:hypothetical protein